MTDAVSLMSALQNPLCRRLLLDNRPHKIGCHQVDPQLA